MTTPLLPDTLKRQENWRYSPVSRLITPDWQLSPATPKNDGFDHCDLLIKDGYARLNEKGFHEAIHIEPLESGLHHNDFHNIHKKFMANGLKLSVEDGAVITEPLRLLFSQSSTLSNPYAAATPLHLVIGKGAEVSISELWQSMRVQDYWALPNIMVELGEGAKLYWQCCSSLPDQVIVTERRRFTLAQSSTLHYGAKIEDLGYRRTELELVLNGEQAEARIVASNQAKETAQIELLIDMQHEVGSCESEQQIHAIADHQGMINFQGKITVNEGADGTNANQQHKALLLSERAEVNAKPALEIYAEDVKCAHGATLGALDPMQLFYLKSRGIEEEAARALLIKGFLAQPFDEIELPSMAGFADYGARGEDA